MSEDAFKKLSVPMTFEDVAADLERENRFFDKVAAGKVWRVYAYFSITVVFSSLFTLIMLRYNASLGEGFSLREDVFVPLATIFSVLLMILALQQWRHARQLKALLDAIKELKEKQS